MTEAEGPTFSFIVVDFGSFQMITWYPSESEGKCTIFQDKYDALAKSEKEVYAHNSNDQNTHFLLGIWPY